MKFTITTSGTLYSSEERISELKEIGFTFTPMDNNGPIRLSEPTFRIQGEPTIEIKDLEELINFSNKWDEIIVSDGYIEIYDSRRE